MNDANPAASPVDFNRLREITGNDPQLFSEISDQYLVQADEIMADLTRAVHNQQMEAISQLAHKLAGSSATCGMNGIVDHLRKLEHLQPDASGQAAELLQGASKQLERIRQTLSQPPQVD